MMNSVAENPVPGRRCYGCYRPVAACFCEAIPRLDNRTEILILQHRRERFHPFNTARIVHRALANSQLLADNTPHLKARLELKPGAGLLYPGPGARLLSDVAPEERPKQLVLLDGTWHHAKTLLREIPALQSLPRFQLTPVEPSRYRIRQEPTLTALSTLEATVAALQILEPETAGCELLLGAFDTMVEQQLAHPGDPNGRRLRKRGQHTYKNVPVALLDDLEHVVVAYGESPGGQRGKRRLPGPPVSWVAQRLATGESFSCKLRQEQPLKDSLLRHLALTQADFADALSLEEARRAWASFQRPTDIVAVLHPGTARLHAYLAGEDAGCLVLKSADVDFSSALATWDDPGAVPPDHCRADHRLSLAIALVRELNAIAKAQLANRDCAA